MTEPNGHCPYLGLKQNRAIRFASPTPEHRCFVSGEPLEIPVDQASYCLAQGHVHCPLYMGLTVPTTSDAPTPIGGIATAGGALVAPTGGMRGWLGTLSPRDRAIYAIMISMLVIIVAIYLFVGLQTLFRPNGSIIGAQPTSAIGTDIAQATQPAASDIRPPRTNPDQRGRRRADRNIRAADADRPANRRALAYAHSRADQRAGDLPANQPADAAANRRDRATATAIVAATAVPPTAKPATSATQADQRAQANRRAQAANRNSRTNRAAGQRQRQAADTLLRGCDRERAGAGAPQRRRGE